MPLTACHTFSNKEWHISLSPKSGTESQGYYFCWYSDKNEGRSKPTQNGGTSTKLLRIPDHFPSALHIFLGEAFD